MNLFLTYAYETTQLFVQLSHKKKTKPLFQLKTPPPPRSFLFLYFAIHCSDFLP